MEIPKTVKELAAGSPSGKIQTPISAADSTDDGAPMMDIKFWVTFQTNKYPLLHYPELTEQEELEAIIAGIPIILGQAQRAKYVRQQKEEYAARLSAQAWKPETAEDL